ncbi:MAG: SH3 domain-containing protein [Lachnospiraceae bacterium]|nr:SH3 domain-containing protein [Lachnospiraceae bacterium]
MNTKYKVRIMTAMTLIVASISLSLIPSLHIHAGNGTLMDVTSSTELKSEASDDSATVKTLNKGDMVFVMGNAGNGWYKVYYQGSYYYIKNNKVKASQLTGNTDPSLVLGSGYQNEVTEDESSEEVTESEEAEVTDAVAEPTIAEEFTDEGESIMTIDGDLQEQLEAEFAQASEDADKEAERIRKAKIQSIVWKVIVAVIIVAMFAVGIITTLKQKSAGDKEDKDNTEDKSDNGDNSKN